MTTANTEKAKLLLLENVNDSAVELLQSSGFSAIERVPKALDDEALHKALKGVSLLGIRSRTSLTPEIFAAADQLAAVVKRMFHARGASDANGAPPPGWRRPARAARAAAPRGP